MFKKHTHLMVYIDFIINKMIFDATILTCLFQRKALKLQIDLCLMLNDTFMILGFLSRVCMHH